MKYSEKVGDLFAEEGDGLHLAHCIAADYGLGAGIAVPFNAKYDMRRRLREVGTGSFPDVVRIDNVYNLVTKNRSYEKPTYENLTRSLYILRGMVAAEGVRKLAIPQIGCGIDGLDWNTVSMVIQEIFRPLDIEITVCIWK